MCIRDRFGALDAEPTVFTGYETLNDTGVVVALSDEETLTDAIATDEEVVVRPKVTELLSPNPADYILDSAGGNGNYSSYLAQRGAAVVAFDYRDVYKRQGRLFICRTSRCVCRCGPASVGIIGSHSCYYCLWPFHNLL